MNLFMLCLWLVATILSLRLNPDLFSPSKFFLLVLGFDFFSIFLRNDYHFGVYLAYVGYIAMALMGSVAEGHQKVTPILTEKSKTKRNVSIIAIWLITLLPILGQVGLIIAMGGVAGYVNSISMRVSEWTGYGAFVLLVKGIVPLHLLYFSRWCSQPDSVKRSGYLLHGSIFLLLAILSGSRGFLLGIVVSMFVIINYLWKPIKLRVVLPAACMIFLVAGVMGVARTNIHFSDHGFMTGYQNVSERLLETTQLGVGCFVINHVLTESAGELPLHGGTTFLSLATAFLPRAIFPDKLRTGGQVSTKYILGDAYVGSSNYTPGILAESILNFGFFFGPIVAYLVLMVFLLAIIYWYRYLRLNLRTGKILYWNVVLYVSIAQIPANLLRAEWTNALRGPITWIFWITIVVIVSDILTQLSRDPKRCNGNLS